MLICDLDLWPLQLHIKLMTARSLYASRRTECNQFVMHLTLWFQLDLDLDLDLDLWFFFHRKRLPNVDTGLQNSVQMLIHAPDVVWPLRQHSITTTDGVDTAIWHVHLYDVLLVLIVTEFCQCDVVVVHQVAVRWRAVSAAWWALTEPRHHLCVVTEQQLQVDGNINVLQRDRLHVVCHYSICAVLRSMLLNFK